MGHPDKADGQNSDKIAFLNHKPGTIMVLPPENKDDTTGTGLKRKSIIRPNVKIFFPGEIN